MRAIVLFLVFCNLMYAMSAETTDFLCLSSRRLAFASIFYVLYWPDRQPPQDFVSQ